MDDSDSSDPATTGVSTSASGQVVERRSRAWRKGLLVLVMIYVFIVAIKLMGHGLKIAARDPQVHQQIEGIFQFASNPFVALCVGVLITSLVQSSSFTTSLTVLFVGTGDLQLVHAIPIIMGANIGTSVTNLLVSLAHIRRPLEFRRALAGASVHDFFNVCSVMLLFPLEVAFGIISRPALALGNLLSGSNFFSIDPKKGDIVKKLVSPFTDGADWFFNELLGLGNSLGGLLTAVLGIVLLFMALWGLVKALRGLMMHRIGNVFGEVLFSKPWTSFAIGIIITTLVQSSSVTTSLAVPLIGAGVLTLQQVYPYTLGANIGTTVTALLAALANSHSPAGAMGLATATGHLMFNLMGTAVFWPLRRIPMSLAKAYARVASRRRIWVAVFLGGFFFVLPATVIVVAWLLE